MENNNLFMHLTELIDTTSKTISRLRGIREKLIKDPKHHSFTTQTFIETMNLAGRNIHGTWGALQKQYQYYLSIKNNPHLMDEDPYIATFTQECEKTEQKDDIKDLQNRIAQERVEPNDPIPSTSAPLQEIKKEELPSILSEFFEPTKRKHDCCCKYRKSAKRHKIDPELIILDSD